MQNKLLEFMRRYDMVQGGDRVICAVSGGGDSVALLFAMHLLSGKLGLQVEAAHFNHRLRGEESDRDEAFVRALCDRLAIPLHVGSGEVKPGKKGLEAAAREARYAFFHTLPGKVATAHTADDNAETVLMHLVRGTGLKGLGGIAPVSNQLIRPMLSVTREQVTAFLEECHLSFVQDSSNDTDLFLRNRLRHHVMPLLKRENPRLGENLSAMALRLREDEQLLAVGTAEPVQDVPALRAMPAALRARVLAAFLERSGLREPSAAHITAAERLVFSQKPSAQAQFPGGLTVQRNYDRLEIAGQQAATEPVELVCPGAVVMGSVRVTARPADLLCKDRDCFTVRPQGSVLVRGRLPGDLMRLPGGTKELKKLFIDRKLPAHTRSSVPVIADDLGVLGVWGFGANLDRLSGELPAWELRFEQI